LQEAQHPRCLEELSREHQVRHKLKCQFVALRNWEEARLLMRDKPLQVVPSVVVRYPQCRVEEPWRAQDQQNLEAVLWLLAWRQQHMAEEPSRARDQQHLEVVLWLGAPLLQHMAEEPSRARDQQCR